MSILDWILLILGITVFISICFYFIIVEIKSNFFRKLGFVGSKEELYDVTFQKFDFDYSVVSGNDNSKNQEGLISDAIKKIDTEDIPTIKEVDYYA